MGALATFRKAVPVNLSSVQLARTASGQSGAPARFPGIALVQDESRQEQDLVKIPIGNVVPETI